MELTKDSCLMCYILWEIWTGFSLKASIYASRFHCKQGEIHVRLRPGLDMSWDVKPRVDEETQFTVQVLWKFFDDLLVLDLALLQHKVW